MREEISFRWEPLVRIFRPYDFSYQKETEPDLDQRIIFDKNTFKPFYVESCIDDVFAEHDPLLKFKFLVRDLEDGGERKSFNVLQLDEKFYTHDEYEDYYEKYKDKVASFPYIMKGKSGSFTFAQKISDDEYLYIMEYYDEGSNEDKKDIVRMTMHEILECNKEPDEFMKRMKNLKSNLHVPASYNVFKKHYPDIIRD